MLDRAATLDAHETDVLVRLADRLSTASNMVIEAEVTDRTPCWWWCEDIVLGVDLYGQVADVGDRSQADVCQDLRAAFVTELGEPTDDDPRNLRYSECFEWWPDVLVEDRHVSVSIDVSTEDSPSGPTAQVHFTNESATRAFLPWNP